MTLSLYVARRFLAMFALVFGVFFGILMLIDVIDQLRRHSDSGISTGQAFVLSSLNVPESLYQILPLVMILSAIALFLNLARSSELVAVRAAGRSGLRFLLAPVLVAWTSRSASAACRGVGLSRSMARSLPERPHSACRSSRRCRSWAASPRSSMPNMPLTRNMRRNSGSTSANSSFPVSV